jgi:hypothetical protein
MNGASDQIDATVVSSLMLMLFELLMPEHGPIAAINPPAALFVPAVRPGLPPVDTTYTRSELEGQLGCPGGTLKCPLASVCTGWLRRRTAPVLIEFDPAAKNWMDAPEIGCSPPCTWPAKAENDPATFLLELPHAVMARMHRLISIG